MHHAQSLRFSNFVLLIAGTLALSGCAEQPKDQSQARLEEMPYTQDIIQQELVDRYLSVNSIARKTEGTTSSGEQGRSSSDGPGGNPFSLERIAEDVVHKLQMVESQTVTAHIDELERKLATEKKLAPQDVQKIVAALRSAAQKSNSTSETPAALR